MTTNVTHRNPLGGFFLTIPHSRNSPDHSLNLSKDDLGDYLVSEFAPQTCIVVEEPHKDSTALHLHALVKWPVKTKPIKDILASIKDAYPSASRRIDVKSLKSAYGTYMYLTEPGYQCKDKAKPVKLAGEIDQTPYIHGPIPTRPGRSKDGPYTQSDWSALCRRLFRQHGIALPTKWDPDAIKEYIDSGFVNH